MVRLRLTNSYCEYRSDVELSDVEHVFCLCVKSWRIWSWLKGHFLILVGIGLGLIEPFPDTLRL